MNPPHASPVGGEDPTASGLVAAPEGGLARVARSVLAGQSGVLGVIALAGFVFTSDLPFTAISDDTVLGLGINGLHSTVLAATAVLGTVVALGPPPWLRWWAVLQTLGFAALVLVGTVLGVGALDRGGMNLNGADHVLHGALALLGVATLRATRADFRRL